MKSVKNTNVMIILKVFSLKKYKEVYFKHNLKYHEVKTSFTIMLDFGCRIYGHVHETQTPMLQIQKL